MVVVRMESQGHPLLVRAVQQALLSADPRTDCAGKGSTVVVTFLLGRNATLPNTIRRLSSTQYEVLASFPVIEVENLDPAWCFTPRGRFLHRLKAWFARLK